MLFPVGGVVVKENSTARRTTSSHGSLQPNGSQLLVFRCAVPANGPHPDVRMLGRDLEPQVADAFAVYLDDALAHH
eukprot:SAG31_NODE_1462_length_8242_cov_5.541135_9_plen_76_part_00